MLNNSSECQISAIIPAAGSGIRAGGSVPKQMFKIMDKCIFEHTIEQFCRISSIAEVIVVQRPDHEREIGNILRKFQTKYHKNLVAVNGGSTRHQSIAVGLKSINESTNVVIIHDSVRPFISEAVVMEIVSWTLKVGACGIVRPLVSTVVSSDSEGYLVSSLNRLEHHASEMPQGFKTNLIKSAYKQCDEYDYEFGTECLHLVQKYCSITPKLLKTNTDLWKVTHRRDLFSADRMIKERDILVKIQSLLSEYPELVSQLMAQFMEENIQVFHETASCQEWEKPNCYIVLYTEILEKDLIHWFENSNNEWGCIVVIVPLLGNNTFEKLLNKTRDLAKISARYNKYLSTIWNCSTLNSENIKILCSKVSTVLLNGTNAIHQQLISF